MTRILQPACLRLPYLTRRPAVHAIVNKIASVRPHELKAFMLAFLCNFVLLGSYYLLRPVRDAMATVFGVGQLQDLFTGTLFLTLVCSPLFAWLTDTFKLSRLLPKIGRASCRERV